MSAPITEAAFTNSAAAPNTAETSLETSAATSLNNGSSTTQSATGTSQASTITQISPYKDEPDFAPPTNGPLLQPIAKPSKSAKSGNPHAVTAEQEKQYQAVLAAVSEWKTLPVSSAKGAALAPLEDHERMWLTRDCILRYLRATKWNVPNAIKRLQGTLTWRREYGADGFTADYISPEEETGKQCLLGYDNESRPCLYLDPGKENTKPSDRQIQALCFMLDRAAALLPPGQESFSLLISFKGTSMGGSSMPSVAQARAALNILQNHSPERLGRALITELPWYVMTFFKLISPFIDPVTREKMKFNAGNINFVPAEQLRKQYGGTLDFEYKHDVYWPAMNELADRRKAEYKQRWEQAGKRFGEYEAYLRGGDQPCLAQVLGDAGNMGEETKENGLDQATAGVEKLNV